MSTVIKVENLSKQYRLGQVGTGTISHDINRWWHKVRGKEDPYLKIGESNDRTVKGESDYVWALKDINFEVQQGEVLGIIGRNGAGKSTLLKILSRTTAPTTGSVKIKGRVASLLEVGTGFHPELSGRDNIFLNGAILGMTRREIQSKFDEIVDFAGVDRYIDTPVKRYSSGMYVRLAFAVAAHLEPEILIVDEVLAVGDAEFQKKALGKMHEVSNSFGRTVLIVSHNMALLRNLCKTGLLLKDGKIELMSNANNCLDIYHNNYNPEVTKKYNKFIYRNRECWIKVLNIEISLSPSKFDDDLEFSVIVDSQKKLNCSVEFVIRDNNQSPLMFYSTGITEGYEILLEVGVNSLNSRVENLKLAEGFYYVDFMIAETNKSYYLYAESAFIFSINESDPGKTGRHFIQGNGSIYLRNIIKTNLETKKISN